MTHPLENKINAPAKDIMDAILAGFRTQIDIKGKLAELYLYRLLLDLKNRGIISNVEWLDTDGQPDFRIRYNNNHIIIECKNLRNESYKTTPSYKVEIQKTRNSKDGTNTRSYRVEQFDILAVCLFNQTKQWEFVFINVKDLEKMDGHPEILKIMQTTLLRVISSLSSWGGRTLL